MNIHEYANLTIFTHTMASLEPGLEETVNEAASHAPVSPSSEPFVGNVSKVSPHYGSSSKDSSNKGNLIFDASFEGGKLLGNQQGATPPMCCVCVGNLGRVDLINDFEYDLFIRPDTCNPK